MDTKETRTKHPPKERSVFSSACLLWPAPSIDTTDAVRKVAPKVIPSYFPCATVSKGHTNSLSASAESTAPCKDAMQLSRTPSSTLLEAGEPTDEGRFCDEDGDGGGYCGGSRTLVVARPSDKSLVGMDMDDTLRRSGVGLMETKVKYARTTRRFRTKESVGDAEGEGESEADPGSTTRAAMATPSASASAAAAISAESNERVRVERDLRPPEESGGGGVGGGLRSRDWSVFSVFGHKAAIKAGGAPGRPHPSSPLLLLSEPASAIGVPNADHGDHDDAKPGAVAIFPGGTTPNRIGRDGDDASRGGNDGSPNVYGVDYMAEARLVKDRDSDEESDSRIEREIVVRRRMSGTFPDLAEGRAPDGTSIPIATAKRLPPLVQFAHNHCLLIAVAALFVVGGIAGLGAYLATRGRVPVTLTNHNGGKVSPPFLSTAHPTVTAEPTTSAAPTHIPTAMPTSAPTMPCGLVPEERASAVANFAAGLIQNSSVLGDASSPQSRALAWLAREDAIDPPLCPGTDDLRLGQRFGLALLHFALGGEVTEEKEEEEEGATAATRWGGGWSYKSSEDRFLDAINECDWAGVSCNSDTRKVRKIELAGRNMRGSLPAEVFTVFEDLHAFDMQNNRITDCLPENIGLASKLEYLYLSANELTCELPSGLGNISGLRELELFDNSFSGTIPANMLVGVGKLRRLILSKNLFSGIIPPQIANLKTLETLHLNENILSSSLPEELSELSNLVSLRLNSNSFDSNLPSSLSLLSRLEELYLHDNNFSGRAFEHLTKLSNLRRLALSHNSFSSSLPEELGRLINIEVLRLESNLLEGTLPASVASLKKLEVFTIQETNIEGNITKEICDLKFSDSGGSGRLRRLSANCYDGDLDECDGRFFVCCSCCDCVYNEFSAADVPDECYPFNESEMDSFPFVLDDAKDGLQPANRSDEIFRKIIDFDVSEEAALSLPSSPQNMAASWIINDDELQLDSSDFSLLQRYAMAVLYFSTEGDGWAQCSAAEGSECARDDFSGKMPFLSGVSACEWAGILCYNDVIESIRLEYNSLGGTVPAKELSGLCLHSLSFRGNAGISINFQSNHISELFSGLYELDLSECAFRDQLHRNLFLPRRVYLNDNLFTGTFPSTASYGRISSLKLQYNQITGNIPSELGLGGSFVELMLDNNLLVGTVPDTFAGLEDIKVLTLHGNELTGSIPTALCDLTFDSGGNLQDLWADCGSGTEAEIKCDCCSQCFN